MGSFKRKVFSLLQKLVFLHQSYMYDEDNIVIKNPSKKVLDLMAEIAKDKAAKQADLRAKWEKEQVENVALMK